MNGLNINFYYQAIMKKVRRVHINRHLFIRSAKRKEKRSKSEIYGFPKTRDQKSKRKNKKRNK